MSESIDRVNEILKNIKSEHNLVAVEKHGGVLRNSYVQHTPEMKPDVVLCDTPPWSEESPLGVFAAENYVVNRNESLAQGRELAADDCGRYINYTKSKAPIIYSWFSTPQIEKIAKATNAEIVVSRDERACAIIEDKARLLNHLMSAGCRGVQMPFHDTFDSAMRLPSFMHIQDAFGLPFVLQGRSMGGDGTFIISSESEYNIARNSVKGNVRLSEFIDAPYSSIYCLSLPSSQGGKVSTYVDVPSDKPVNIAELGVGNVSGAGGDWRASREDCNIQEITRNIQKLAQYFYHKWGYFGHFVVEGFHMDGKFLFNEINARPGGGSEVNSCNQLERGVPSFTSLHILGRLGLVNSEIYDVDIYNHQTASRVIKGSEQGAVYLKYKNSHDNKVEPSSYYKGSGVYKLAEGNLIWQRETSVTMNADLDKSEFLLANGPLPQAFVGAGKQVCTFEAYGRRSILDKNLQLNQTGKALARAAHRLFVSEREVY